MANLEWCDMWKDAGVEVMVCCSLDHLSLLLSLTKREVRGKKWRPFRYEARWSKNGHAKKIIKEVWAVRKPTKDPWMGFNGKIHRCRKALAHWVRK